MATVVGRGGARRQVALVCHVIGRAVAIIFLFQTLSALFPSKFVLKNVGGVLKG